VSTDARRATKARATKETTIEAEVPRDLGDLLTTLGLLPQLTPISS